MAVNVDQLVNFDDTDVSADVPTKLDALIRDLEIVREQDRCNSNPRNVTKSIIFSQFTAMLTLCEVFRMTNLRNLYVLLALNLFAWMAL